MSQDSDWPKEADPVEQFEDEVKKQKDQTRQRHIDLWHQWNNAGRQREHMEPLVQAFHPLIESKMRRWNYPTIPQEVLRIELKKQVAKAMPSFDPTKGIALSTHVFNYVKGAQRFANELRGTTFVPEEKSQAIRPITSARDEFMDEHGREPTHQELAEMTGYSVKQIQDTASAVRRNVNASAFVRDPTPQLTPRHLEILPFMPDHIEHKLGLQAREIFEYQHGLNGRPKIESPGDIARRMGLSAPSVSKHLDKIRKTYNEAL